MAIAGLLNQDPEFVQFHPVLEDPAERFGVRLLDFHVTRRWDGNFRPPESRSRIRAIPPDRNLWSRVLDHSRSISLEYMAYHSRPIPLEYMAQDA
jgi:hypothetical protein